MTTISQLWNQYKYGDHTTQAILELKFMGIITIVMSFVMYFVWNGAIDLIMIGAGIRMWFAMLSIRNLRWQHNKYVVIGFILLLPHYIKFLFFHH